MTLVVSEKLFLHPIKTSNYAYFYVLCSIGKQKYVIHDDQSGILKTLRLKFSLQVMILACKNTTCTGSIEQGIVVSAKQNSSLLSITPSHCNRY